MHTSSARRSLRYLLSLTPGSLALFGNLIGGYWALSSTLYTVVLLIFIEQLMKENRRTGDIEDATVPNIILSTHVVLHSLTIASLIYGIHTGILNGRFILYGTISTGISSGIEGINSAHELIHRKRWVTRAAGIWNLLVVNYGHFYIEHVRGHHRYVGTLRDPATARYGESFYRFFVRTVPQQYWSATNLEAERLRKENKFGFGIENFVIQITLAEIVLCGLIFYFFGSTVFLAYTYQSVIAFFLLEYVNYIEHYGLVRKEGQKVNPAHSWQSDLPISRFALIELSRHSDHHITASKPFHTLTRYDESPVLPSGYFGSFYTALIPPLWFRMVHPVLNNYWKTQPSD